MRSRILPAVGISAIALVAASSFAGQASAHGTKADLGASHQVSAQKVQPLGKKGCYSNQKNDEGTGVTSANYSDQTGIDAAGAADFKVKKTCKITKVQTTGIYYNGAGPADSVNVIFYAANKKGLPGKVVSQQNKLKYTDSTGTGSLGVKLKKTVNLKKGNYFVSFVANMTFAVGGQWGWEISTDQPGKPDLWQNPDDGFGTGCVKWQPLECIGFTGDWMVNF